MPLFSFENIPSGNEGPQRTKAEEKQLLFLSIFMPLVCLAIMWIVHLFSVTTGTDLHTLGIYPHKASGLIGIITAPFIHADWDHLISNSIPFFILSFLMIYSYRKVAFISFIVIWLGSGILLWLTGRPSYHIGASSVVYGIAFFIFFSGVFRRNVRDISLSLLVVFVYGSIVWGLFPIDIQISWEGHLMGAITGSILAFIFRNVDRPMPVILEEDDEEEEQELDIHYLYTEKKDDK